MSAADRGAVMTGIGRRGNTVVGSAGRGVGRILEINGSGRWDIHLIFNHDDFLCVGHRQVVQIHVCGGTRRTIFTRKDFIKLEARGLGLQACAKQQAGNENK